MEVEATQLALEALEENKLVQSYRDINHLNDDCIHVSVDSEVGAHLFKHSEEHFSAEVAECWSLVRMYFEAVRPDLHILVPERLSVEDDLHHHALLDVRHGVNCLE